MAGEDVIPNEAVSPAVNAADDPVATALAGTFGFTELRPLQREAIEAALQGRDALVVLPTGGGKSLCYQLPPLVTGRLTVVVSPLIALMQDQVDGLRLLGYPAAALHGNLAGEDRAELRRLAATDELRLLLVAPERLFHEPLLRWLEKRDIGAFAIDEAHCISQWGHDFRPEYRRLAELRARFPDVPCHAYTATATPRVQDDIRAQLRLRDPAVHVGTFDRPNLTYRVLPRIDAPTQIAEAIGRHPQAAAIVYCISRKDTEQLAAELRRRGIDAAAYHAGLGAAERTRISADFRAERLAVVVATVAFGMGIDRGDVRLVVHAAMPKSIEHYQQETGRAGRDGLPAECLLLYSAADAAKWRVIVQRSAAEAGADDASVAAQLELLAQMQRFAARARCRHRALTEYFGQEYGAANCGACDACLDELEAVPDAHVVAQKILSAVARTGERFGSSYVIDVLRGRKSEKVTARGHDRLPTFGVLAEVPAQRLGNFVDQLVDDGLLERTEGEYPVLALTPAAAAVLRGERAAELFVPKHDLAARPRKRGDARGESARELSVPESMLFESLRELRRSIAQELQVPPYLVFSDVTLEELAARRPSDEAALLHVRGVGPKKVEAFGERFLRRIAARSGELALALDAGTPVHRPAVAPRRSERAQGRGDGAGERSPSPIRERAAELFRRGVGVAEAARELERASSTTVQYLCDWLRAERPPSLSPWIDDELRARIEAALRQHPGGRLAPVHAALGGSVGYDEIRIVATFLADGAGGTGTAADAAAGTGADDGAPAGGADAGGAADAG